MTENSNITVAPAWDRPCPRSRRLRAAFGREPRRRPEHFDIVDAGIAPIWPGARIVGSALTVLTVAGDNKAVIDALDLIQPGDVLVINAGGHNGRAIIGDNLAQRFELFGATGAIIDGCARDRDIIESLGFPVFARGVTPAGPFKNGPGRHRRARRPRRACSPRRHHRGRLGRRYRYPAGPRGRGLRRCRCDRRDEAAKDAEVVEMRVARGSAMTVDRLRVVVAAPLSAADAARIVELEPRIDLVYEPALLPPMRHAADFAGDPEFRRTTEQQRAFDDLVDSADVLYGILDVDSAALARAVRANPRLRWVQTMAAGGGAQVRAAGLSTAELDRVAFTTSAGAHGGPLAEFAVFGVFAAPRISRLSAQKSAHAWTGRWTMRQVSDLTVLVLGLGGIGTETARKLSALGARVIAFNRSGEGSVEGVSVQPMRLLHEHLPQADAVVVTLPGTASTEGLLDDNFFATLTPGATIVNVGRGTVIDEPALLRALESGQVGLLPWTSRGRALDPASALWDHPNVVISPHTAALDPREESRIAALFADNAGRFLDDRPLRNVVDTVEFY